jgi:hypothetical protein
MARKNIKTHLERRQVKRAKSIFFLIHIALMALTVICLFPTILISRFTFISKLTLAGIFLFSAISMGLITLPLARKYQFPKFTLKRHLLQSGFAFGLIGTCLFLLINWQLATRQPKNIVLPIQDTWFGKSRTIYVQIQYNGFVERYGFGQNEQIEIERTGHLELEVDQGFLGYEILLDKRPHKAY